MTKFLLVLLALVVFVMPVFAQIKRTPPVAGKALYTKYCLSCHQADGGGVDNMNPPLVQNPYVSGDKAAAIGTVLNGSNMHREVNGNTYNNRMPAFNYLSDKDIADVLTYIRTHYAKAGRITAAEVASVRGAVPAAKTK